MIDIIIDMLDLSDIYMLDIVYSDNRYCDSKIIFKFTSLSF